MTPRGYYLRAALAQRNYLKALARMDHVSQILWKGRPLKRWRDASRRAQDVANERYFVFEVLRGEARDRMLFDPWEEKDRREIHRQFVEARRRSVS